MNNVTEMVPPAVKRLREIAQEGKLTTWVIAGIEDGHPTMIPDGEVEPKEAFELLYEASQLAYRQDNDDPDAA